MNKAYLRAFEDGWKTAISGIWFWAKVSQTIDRSTTPPMIADAQRAGYDDGYKLGFQAFQREWGPNAQSRKLALKFLVRTSALGAPH